MAKGSVLPLQFHRRDTTLVAKELLGKILVHTDRNGNRVSGRIVETEAYLGANDRACHSFGDRRTKRTAAMYLSGGHAYVFMIYGMYYCFNVVTRAAGQPEAVLIRALEPLDGIEVMRKRRPGAKRIKDLTNGPGKLCSALGIDVRDDAHRLIEKPIWIESDGVEINQKQIVSSPRVGVDYAGDHALWPLRFYIRDNEFVSKPRG